MNFWQIFLRVLPWRPAAALKSAWYHLTRRRVRAWNRLRVAGSALPFAYDLWMRNIEREDMLAERAAANAGALSQVTFTVVIDGREGSASDVAQSLASIQRQSAPVCHETKIIERGGDEDLRQPLISSRGDFVVVLRAGTTLALNALFIWKETIQRQGDADIFYGDEDRIDEEGSRVEPFFKPGWNAELFLATDYLSGACALRTSSVVRAAESLTLVTIPALILAIVDDDANVVHVPHILVHKRQAVGASSVDHLAAVEGAVAQDGATVGLGPYGSVRVNWPLPPDHTPLVSVIVPTRDKVELLKSCVSSLLDLTSYPSFELIIVDNGSVETATRQFLDEIITDARVRVLAAPGAYNFSSLNNQAARVARGEFLCLLNNDTEIVEAEWLSEMMRYAIRPSIGAVGAKLLYADRSIQHAGVVVGIGDAAGHAHRFLKESDPGYFHLPHLTHYVTAVTGACLLVAKEKFEAVRGLDAESFAVAYNDIDFCLKLEHAGWRNIYVPHAVLIHHESKSRGKDHAPDQIDRYRGELRRFQERWCTADYRDPMLNPNLDRSSETYLIRF